MLEALFDSNSSCDGVLKGVEAETERRETIENFIEELPALLDFKVVSPVHSPFEDCASSIELLWFSFAT